MKKKYFTKVLTKNAFICYNKDMKTGELTNFISEKIENNGFMKDLYYIAREYNVFGTMSRDYSKGGKDYVL